MRIVAMAALGSALLATPALAEEPAAPQLVFAFEEIVTLGPSVTPGETPRGKRNIIPITGGRFDGPGHSGEGFKGEVMPGGWDWQLIRPDGCVEVEADYFLKTDDGVVINIVNKGSLCPPKDGGAPAPTRTHPVFEAPIGKYEWLNRSAFVGTLELADPSEGHAVKIRIYRAQ
jgi:hypothetical protein